MNTLIYTACLGLFGLLAEIFNLRKYLIPILIISLEKYNGRNFA